MKRKNPHSRALLSLCALAAASPWAFAQPTSGAYVDDRTNTYVQDQVLQSVDTVNMVMCVMSSMRAETQVNAGAYVALIDKNKCDSKGSKGEVTNAGADAAVDYIDTVVNSTRTGTDPMDVRAWLKLNDEDGRKIVYANTTVTEGASSTKPNGVFSMRYTGYPEGMPTMKFMHGNLSASDSTLSFYEEGSYSDGARLVTFTTALSLTLSGTTSGSGRLREAYSDTAAGQPVDGSFSYNATHFLRERTGGSQQCFSRSAAEADSSVWRYGVYKADGSRHDVANPGFQITYAAGGTTYYGYAGYYGIYLPPAAMTAIATAGYTGTVTRPETGAEYTMGISGGRLTKLTRKATTLEKIKGVPLRVWLLGATGETKMYWSGTAFEKTETIACSNNGCESTAASGTVSAGVLYNNGSGMRVLNGYSDSLGSFSIQIPTAGDFAGSNEVVFRTREAVPAATAASLSLVCVSQCPGNIAKLGTTSVYENVGTGPYNWGPVAVGNAVTYVFNASGMMFVGSTSASNAVDASALSLGNSPNKWGIRSGTLVEATATGIQCDSNGGTGTTHYCPQAINDASVTYEWETGIQPWNWTITLTNQSTSQAATFTPPVKLEVVLSTSNSSLRSTDKKIDSTLYLDFNGFGQLNGIPGSCYDAKDNSKVPCGGPDTRYAPDFSLKAGATVLDRSTNTTYYVKPLDQEMRFAKVSLGNCASLQADLTTAKSVTLPSSTGADPRDTIGATIPTPANSKPAVIHGVVQTQ